MDPETIVADALTLRMMVKQGRPISKQVQLPDLGDPSRII